MPTLPKCPLPINILSLNVWKWVAQNTCDSINQMTGLQKMLRPLSFIPWKYFLDFAATKFQYPIFHPCKNQNWPYILPTLAQDKLYLFEWEVQQKQDTGIHHSPQPKQQSRDCVETSAIKTERSFKWQNWGTTATRIRQSWMIMMQSWGKRIWH